ncbi:MAG: hypothetical protein IJ762_12145 [Bacteroidaceae bacterium]|nr:hypothetical protein [Bacteroidaceae bacterium]
MSKLKLKSVQSPRSGGTTGATMYWGDILLYQDESGNWIDDSGNIYFNEEGKPVDGSGNVQEEGWIGVVGGYQLVTLSYDADPINSQVEITWGSGAVSLPFLEITEPRPFVSVDIHPLGEITIEPHWISPLTVRLDHGDIRVDLFTLPYEYHAPSNEDE